MEKILIVDDKLENSYLLKSLLKGNGYETVSAKNGFEALDIALKDKFILIISDILMPVMDGFTFCRECKKNKSLEKIPFIFYTATYTTQKDEEFALSLGADKFILKPQDPDKFMEIVNEVLKEVKAKKKQFNEFPALPEEIILKEYNSALIRKLEDKMAQTEEASNELLRINAQLQKEIDEHKQTEKALRDSELKFRVTFEDASVGMCLTGLDGSFILVNSALSGMLGYSKEELINKKFIDFTQKDDLEPSLNWLNKMISGELRMHRFEKRFLHKNGNVVFADVNINLINDSGGRPLFFVTHLINITKRKIAEELLNSSEARYRRLFESAKDGILIIEANNGIIIDVNPFMLEMLGCLDEDIIGEKIWALKCFKDIAADQDKFFELRQKEYVHFENLIIETFKGYQLHVEFVSNVYTVNRDKVIHFNIRDITERKRMKEEVRESEERFRMVFENVFDGICLYIEDPDPSKRKLVECNERYAAMAGRSREELLRMGNTLALQKTLESSANDTRLQALSSNKEFSGSFSWIRPDGKENFIEYVGKQITWRGKLYSIGIDRDVTERRRTENKLRKLSRAVEQSPVSIIITDRSGIIEYINPRVTAITGYQDSEVIGNNPRMFSSGVQPESYYKNLWDTIISGKDWWGELQNKKKNGELYWESVSISPVFDEDGTVTHFIAIKEDITERKNILKDLILSKEKAEQSDKLKTEFLAQMSHEIRTPMNAIISFTDLLKDGYFEQITPELSGILNSIGSAGKRITRTVDLILNASEMQIGTYHPSFSDIDLEEKILNVIRSEYFALAKQKGIQLNFKNKLPFAVINGDDYSINQIFVNLIDNAVKYTEVGYVDILIDRNKKKDIFVTISDTGVGISDDYKQYLFEPFMQEERGYSRRFEGNGLGLSLTKRYCDMNGINISVESQKGLGSKFTVTFTT